MTEHLQRVVVIGSSCAGKTTFARELARRLDSTHIELDAIHWMPNWVAREREEFRQLVAGTITAKHWVADGNYSAVRNVLWPRATAIIWLNYSFGIVARRAIRRTLRRTLWNEELYAGNRESLRCAFLSRDSILWWIIKTFRRHRREFQELRTDNTFPNLQWIEFRTPTEATNFLQSLEADASALSVPKRPV